MKKFMKVFLILTILLGLISSKLDVAKADDEIGNISVHVNIENLNDPDGEPMDLPGMEFNVYQIWKVIDNEIVFNDQFKDVTEINGEMTSNEIQKTANDFLSVSYGAPIFANVKTDNNGRLNLDAPLGAYLFVQTVTLEYMEEAFNCTPFLVTVPFQDPISEEWTNEVDATPKVKLFRTLPADKVVNGDKLYNADDFDEEFKYTITSEVPYARSKFSVADYMEPVLIFPKDKRIEDFVSVRFNGEELSPYELSQQITLEEHAIIFTATEEQLQERQGQEVVLEFTAYLDKEADLTDYLEGVPNAFTLHIDDKVDIQSEPCIVTPPDKPSTPPNTPRFSVPNTAAWLIGEAREHPHIFYPTLILILALIFIIIKKIVDRRKLQH